MENSEPAMWSKSHKSWGRNRRQQRNYYAYLVAMVMTGGRDICPTCHGSLSNAEVDRPIPSLDYRPGNCVYICKACNQGRSVLQSIQPIPRDWSRIADYVADVQRASESVAIPTVAHARAWCDSRETGGGGQSRYA